MDEAIDLVLEERSPYPDLAHFIDADSSDVGGQIKEAFAEGAAAVVVSADGSKEILYPESPAAPGEIEALVRASLPAR
jgi:hypothetical protein